MPGARLFQTVQFPTSNRYQEQVGAWVSFTPDDFSTLPNSKNNVAGSSYILPLQGYNSPSQADFADTTPSPMEMAGQGIRDMFAGGGVGKLMALATNFPISQLGGLSISNVTDIIGGLGGASLTDVSFSDLTFTKMLKREHTFTFKLFAKSSKDAALIDEIVSGMQARMYPMFLSRTLNKVQPPAMWGIKIFPNGGGKAGKLVDNSIQTSVLTSLNISRLDAAAAVLGQDNNFVGVGVQASFTEIEPAYRSFKDVNKIFSRDAAGSGDII